MIATSTAPMNAAQWQLQLTKFGVPFNVTPTFKDPKSGRDGETGLVFGPMVGCGIHHTGDDAPDDLDLKVIVNGRSDLPGPLAHGGLRDDGVIDLVTTGRANHFGGGDPDVLAAVRKATYTDYPPETDKHQGEAGAVDGNDGFYGLEVYYSGKNWMTAVQYESAVGWAAAICDFHGWAVQHVIGHKEWSDYKVDPGKIDMKTFRADVMARLAGHRKPTGPKFVRPNITKAIEANIAYSQAIGAVTFPEVQASITEIQKVLKQQRKALRRAEKKGN